MQSSAKIRVAIADDHTIFIEGLSSLFRDSPIELVCTASSAEELLSALSKQKVDVVLVDIQMPDINGIDLTYRLAKEFPGIRVLGLTMLEDTKALGAMLQAGASGFITKSVSKVELFQAIHTVANGGVFIDRSLSRGVWPDKERGVTRLSEIAPKSGVQLTKREREILLLIANQLTTLQIANRLNVSPLTVITHRRNIKRKLGVKNSVGLIRNAIELGLVKKDLLSFG